MATNRVGHTGENVYPHDETAHDSLTHEKKEAHLPPGKKDQSRSEDDEEPAVASSAPRPRVVEFGAAQYRTRPDMKSRAQRTAREVRKGIARSAEWIDQHPLRFIAAITVIGFSAGFILRIAGGRHEQ